MKRKADYFVFFIFISILLTFYAVFILGQKDISETENRKLSKFQTFEMKSFLDKTFQDNLESAISDQIVISQKVKKKALEIRKDAIDLLDNTILKVRNNENGKYYVAISKDTYRLNQEEWLIYKPGKYPYNPKTVDYFNQIKNVDKYLYFVESDCSKMYNDKESKNDVYDDIVKNIEATKTSEFKVDTFEEYKEYFYKTDHHWNHKGQYRGYQEIADLLGIPKEEQVKIMEEKEYDTYFFGSKAREATEYDIQEKFTVYQYDNVKPKEIYINGKLGQYGASEKYDKGEYETKQTTNHYGQYYGDDYAEVIYNFDSPEKENLLIISNSYSNAINEILASHFNKTYIIDLRSNQEFNPNEYIKQNKIDKVLILGNMSLFGDTYFKNIDLNNI